MSRNDPPDATVEPPGTPGDTPDTGNPAPRQTTGTTPHATDATGNAPGATTHATDATATAPGATTQLFGRARPRLVVAGLVALAALLVAGFTGWMEARRTRVLDAVEESLAAISSYRAALVEAWIRERGQDAQMVAQRPEIHAVLTARNREDAVVDAIAVMDILAYSGDWVAGIVTDTEGTVVAGTTVRAPVADTVGEAALRAVRSGRSAVIASRTRDPRSVRVAFAAPVLADAQNTIRGAVVHVVDPKVHLFPILTNPAVQGATGETLIVQPDARGLVPLSPVRLDDRPVPGEPVVRVPPDRTEPAHAATRSSYFEAIDYRREPVFVASHPVAGSPWVVVSKRDRADAMESFERERLATGAAFIALYLAIAAASAALWRQYRARYYKALAAEEARYMALFQQSHDAAGIVAKGLVVLANPAAVRMWGFDDARRMVGRDVWTLFSPDSAALLRQRIAATSTATGADTREVTGVRPDGSSFQVELRTSRVSWQGRPAFLVTGRDVTERRRAEDTLQRYHALAENARDIILFLDLDGRVLEANRAAVQAYGYDRGALVGMDASALRAPGHGPGVRERIAQARLGEVFYETVHRRSDGSAFPVETSARAIVIGGRPLVLAVVRDVSERKRLERQSLLAQRMESLGRLAGGVAHDFNNLLTAIRGYAGLIQETLDVEDPRWADLEEIVRSSDRASNLTRQLLAFSRQQASEPRVVDLNELVRGLQKMLRRVIGEDVELNTELADGPLPVRVDPGQIENLLVNLAVNARDAMPRGGTLTVGTTLSRIEGDEAEAAGLAPGPYVRLAVRDTGVGMSDEVKARAFEPFFTTKEPGKGTGLGLSTCYGIAKQHRGQIVIDSEPGLGTTVFLDLPRSAEPIAAMQVASEGAGPRGAETVLLAEDDPGVRAFTARVLRDLGYDVLETQGGVEALTLAMGERGHRIALLVSDVVMPRMSGVELRNRLRVVRPLIRTLFISGYTESAAVQVGHIDPEDHVLRKPFTPTGLARKVREVLDETSTVN